MTLNIGILEAAVLCNAGIICARNVELMSLA